MCGVFDQVGRKEGKLRGMTKQLYEMRYIVAKSGRQALGGRVGRKVCSGGGEAS